MTWQPYPAQLFGMSLFLVGAMLVGTVVSAWLFRNVYSGTCAVASMLESFIVILAVIATSQTGSAVLTTIASVAFGGAIGSTLASFVTTATDGKSRGAEAVAMTIAVIAIAMIAAAIIGSSPALISRGSLGLYSCSCLFSWG